ncbi:hypothetical protein NPS53_08820 [Pseudomonas putida]|uniref:hypothetical protein n=1 Tax=Pseudomonas putida TaxID=303 RepID=UPI0023647AEC|nr:hypothetical protein [Pseudomonas putida]MDD2139676.1 hypothetical protein [Pseudomonas putida]HDS1721600.1 hypothetical protein [Pseudomonas putida]
MRIHTTASVTDLKTVKRQGAYIAEAWQRLNGVSVDVRAIKRIGKLDAENQWGFVVLESLFSTYLCHYSYEGGPLSGVRLVVTPERQMSLDNPNYLLCPAKLLAMAEVENSRWRESVRTYAAAVAEVTEESVGSQATLFLMKAYSQREYGEPFYVLQKDGSQWFGIDCYGRKRTVNLNLGIIHEHCPRMIDVNSQRPYDPGTLASDCVNTGVLIYKEQGNHVTLLGRPMTNLEVANDRLSKVPRFKFELHGDCPWAA